jgi:glycosyltransferase involved in cell wall biosynthesis
LFKVAVRLREYGYEPVITSLASSGDHLTPREHEALEGLQQLRLAPFWDRTRPARPAENSQRLSSSSIWHDVLAAFDARMPVDSWLALLLAHKRQVIRFSRKNDVRAVIASADPWSNLVLGVQVAKALKVPLLSDFRDPWTLCDVRNAKRPPWVRALDRCVEAWVLAHSSRIVLTADEARRRYAAGYPQFAAKMSTVTNGFDSRLYRHPVDWTAETLHNFVSPRTTVDILSFGRFRELSPARAAIRWLAGAARRRPEVLGDLRVQSMGELTQDDAREAQSAGVLDCFEAVAAVPYESALARQRQADLLLVTTDEARTDMIPAKLFDALASGRPIVALSKNPDVRAIVEASGRGICLVPGTDQACELLLSIVDAKKNGRPMPLALPEPTRSLAAFDADEQASAFVRLLNEVLA